MTMKMSRRERKIYNEGKQAGYYKGYAEGLHDGNPFIMFAEAVGKVANTIAENYPEILALAERKEEQEEGYEN